MSARGTRTPTPIPSRQESPVITKHVPEKKKSLWLRLAMLVGIIACTAVFAFCMCTMYARNMDYCGDGDDERFCKKLPKHAASAGKTFNCIGGTFKMKSICVVRSKAINKDTPDAFIDKAQNLIYDSVKNNRTSISDVLEMLHENPEYVDFSEEDVRNVWTCDPRYVIAGDHTLQIRVEVSTTTLKITAWIMAVIIISLVILQLLF